MTIPTASASRAGGHTQLSTSCTDEPNTTRSRPPSPMNSGRSRRPALWLVGEPNRQHGQHRPAQREPTQDGAGEGTLLDRDERGGGEDEGGDEAGGQRAGHDPRKVAAALGRGFASTLRVCRGGLRGGAVHGVPFSKGKAGWLAEGHGGARCAVGEPGVEQIRDLHPFSVWPGPDGHKDTFLTMSAIGVGVPSGHGEPMTGATKPPVDESTHGVTDERHVVIVTFDSGQILDVTGPLEVFSSASRFLPAVRYRTQVVTTRGGPVRANCGLEFASSAIGDVDRARRHLGGRRWVRHGRSGRRH